MSPVPIGQVNTLLLKTATGSASGSVAANIAMNDYCFFPSMTNAGALGNIALPNMADPGNTIGRFWVDPNAQTYTVRWRYITASDYPFVQIIKDVLGEIVGIWESEDPPEQFCGKSKSDIESLDPKILPLWSSGQASFEIYYPCDIEKFKILKESIVKDLKKNFFDYFKDGQKILDLSAVLRG